MCNDSPLSDIRSIEISHGTSLAAYWTCRSGLTPEAPDMDFDRIITAPTSSSECIKIVHRDPDSTERTLTFQLVSNMTDVCYEYARTAARFCDMDECSEGCETAVSAMREFGADANCAGVDVQAINYGMDKKVTKKSADEKPLFMVKPKTLGGNVHGGQGGVKVKGLNSKAFTKHQGHHGGRHGHNGHDGHDGNGHGGSQSSQQNSGGNTQQGNSVRPETEHVCFYKLQHDLEEINAECEEGRFIFFVLSSMAFAISVASCMCLCRRCNRRSSQEHIIAP